MGLLIAICIAPWVIPPQAVRAQGQRPRSAAEAGAITVANASGSPAAGRQHQAAR